MSKAKKIKLYCFFITLFFIFTPLLLFLYSCTTIEDRAWNKIKDDASIEELMSFAAEYKNSGQINEINKKIRDKINAEEDPEKLIYLIQYYPEREYELKDRISEIAFNAALKVNTAESLEEYISKFSDYGKNTKYINEAKSMLKNMYFSAAKEQKSIALFEEFIRRYEREDSVMSADARSLIDDINWETAQSGGTRPDYENYVKEAEKNGGKYISDAGEKIEECDWNTALEKSISEGIILPLKNFTDSYPNSVYLPEASRMINEMQNDSSYFEKYFSTPDLDLAEEFILNFPGHKDMEKAEEIRQTFISDIYSFIAQGRLKATVTGDSITRTLIVAENLTSSRLIVEVPFGAYFSANAGNIQNMLVREEKTFTVYAGQNRSIYIKTASMNIHKDIPEKTSLFSVHMLSSGSPLIKLLKVLSENESSYEVTQTAVWHMTDSPGKDILLNTLIYADGTDAISGDDYNEAMRIIETVSETNGAVFTN